MKGHGITNEDYIEYAKLTFEDEGTIEIDDNAKVSRCTKGAYVQAWVWCEKRDVFSDKRTGVLTNHRKSAGRKRLEVQP